MKLRDYQQQAVDSVWSYIRSNKGNPCIVIPTGGGKTPILGQLCSDALAWNGRVIVMAHVKELLAQAYESIPKINPDLREHIGLYSAGLKSREKDKQIIIAGIQSVFSKADQMGRFDLMIIDEVHLLPTEGEGMYRQFIEDALVINPRLRIVGLTATPYRMKGGLICRKDHFINDVCYEIGIKELIGKEYLCPVTAKAGTLHIDTDGLRVTGGDFNKKDEEEMFDEVIESACIDIINKSVGRKSILVFSSSISHAEKVKEILESRFFEGRIECIFGDTHSDLRSAYISDFKSGKIRCLINVNCLTTGFDAPNVDCIALVRATVSPGLYSQMLGRGFRISEGKTDCLVLDFGNNILRHGPVDQIVIQETMKQTREENCGKECPECGCLMANAVKECPDCGYVFKSMLETPDPHEGKASELEPLSQPDKPRVYIVDDVMFDVHAKRGADDDHPKTLKITYYVSDHMNSFCEYVCVEHHGFALSKAVKWWEAHTCDRFPTSAQDGVDLLSSGAFAQIISITVMKEGKYDRIINRSFNKNTEMREVEVDELGDLAGVPF